MRIRGTAALAIGIAASTPLLAQTSASYKVAESALNNGADPTQGSVLASASFHVKLDAIGDDVAATGMTSASYRSDAGFAEAYRPPLEVLGQTFTSKTTMTWTPDPSVGVYEVYRDTVAALRGGGFGTCFASSLPFESATESANPGVGQGWFYLVTARNRLREEGTKGRQSSGVERPNAAPCP